MSESIDQKWWEGKSRCSYCVGLPDDEFYATCDCSRAYWEQTGQQLFIGLVGSDRWSMVQPRQEVTDDE